LARVVRVSAGHATTSTALTMGTVEVPGAIVGTPHFMSPEAVRGQMAEPAVDLWALCVVLYYALTGSYPFVGPDVAAIFSSILEGRPVPPVHAARPDLAAGFGPFFLRAFAAKIPDRHLDAAALAADLLHLRADYA
jgi:serine/threonine-protein kinase